MRKAMVGWYGSKPILRVYCEACQGMTMVANDKRKLCCDELATAPPESAKRMTRGSFRKQPSADYKAHQLEIQRGKCFYCDHEFGDWVTVGVKPVELLVRWDHFVPYSFIQDNPDQNFVAACQICNAIKHNRMFVSLEQAKSYIMGRWRRREIDAVA